MKKFDLKSSIIGFALGAVFFTGASYAAYEDFKPTSFTLKDALVDDTLLINLINDHTFDTIYVTNVKPTMPDELLNTIKEKNEKIAELEAEIVRLQVRISELEHSK